MRSFLARLTPYLLQFWATVRIAFKRLLTQRFLSLAAIAGLWIASGFIFSIPLYADATYFRLFRDELFAGHLEKLAGKPVDYAPLAFAFDLNVAGRASPQWEDVGPVDAYLSGSALHRIGFPITAIVRRFRTDGYFLYPPLDPDVPSSKYYLTSIDLAFIDPIEETVHLVAGAYPLPVTSPLLGVDPIPGLISDTYSQQLGIAIGDIYYLRQDDYEIPVTITGIWTAVDPDAPYWGPQPETFLIVNEDSYTGAISAEVPDELRDSMWYIVADGSRLHAPDIAGLETRIAEIEKRAGDLLANTKLLSSPSEALDRYQTNVPALTYLLFAFSVPILGLILAFIGLVTELFVGEQRGEMAILRSRGASALQVVGILLLQGVLLGLVALAGGIFLGNWIARAIGLSRSFLDFGATGGLRVSLTPTVLGFGLGGIGLIILFLFLFPALGAARNTIISYKQERARLLRPPWWQRYWLDLVLLLPAGYGLWQLESQSRQALAGAQSVPDPLRNPLLLIAPALGIFAVALFTLRLVPRFMALLSTFLRTTKSVGMLMAARYLSRTPAFYSAPLVLLLLTLGLSAFTASLAKTMDGHLEKQTYYQVGADMSIAEKGTNINDNSSSPVFAFRPVEEHLGLAGVRSATRVGRYSATAKLGNSAMEGQFIGIDRISFPGTAYWQRNFASRSLIALMNELGANIDGVLVSRDFLQAQELKIGDELILSVRTGVAGESIPLTLHIVGTFDLFPTWYPENGPAFVGNLDELFLQAGAEYPYEVWMGTRRNADPEGIVYAVRGYSILLDRQADQTRLVENGLNTQITSWDSSALDILAEQQRPERQGLFGLLSVGFIASSLLTVLGFMLYALFSFRRRFIEMGMLRAIGLSIEQMRNLLAAELASLIGLGVGAGTVVGVFASLLFVPFLKIGASSHAQFPPFQIEIAWLSIFEVYLLFAGLFVAALWVLSRVLIRMKIFQAIKLGETS